MPLSWHEDANIIVGQSHFIKTVEDVAEIVGATCPGPLRSCLLRGSGPCLIRTEGNDPARGGGHSLCPGGCRGPYFFLVLKNAYPINILTAIKACPEVCRIFCATGNPVQVIVAATARAKASWA